MIQPSVSIVLLFATNKLQFSLYFHESNVIHIMAVCNDKYMAL